MKVEWKEHDLQHASNIAEAEERAKTDPYFRHAYEMVKHGGYTWEQALTHLALALGDARNKMLKEYQRHLERCVGTPIVVHLTKGE